MALKYEDVVRAANSLLLANKKVTVRSVKSELGSGSLGTIAKHLKVWRETNQDHQLPASLVSLTQALWSEALKVAEEQFADDRSVYEEDLENMREELNEAYASIEDTKEQHRICAEELDKTVNELRDSRSRVQSLIDGHQSEKRELLDSLSGFHRQVRGLEEKLNTANDQYKEQERYWLGRLEESEARARAEAARALRKQEELVEHVSEAKAAIHALNEEKAKLSRHLLLAGSDPQKKGRRFSRGM